MILGTVVKEVAEVFPVAVDFVNRLPTGDAITIATVDAYLYDGTQGASSTGILSGSPRVVDTVVQQDVMSGTDATNYLLEFRATTVLGYVLEDEVVLAVREDYRT